jgi:hypothetical protein
MTENPYQPPKSEVAKAEPKPAATVQSKAGATYTTLLGVVLLLFGAHFDDPARAATLHSPLLVLAATAMHLGGGVVLVLGLYRLYKAMR